MIERHQTLDEERLRAKSEDMVVGFRWALSSVRHRVHVRSLSLSAFVIVAGGPKPFLIEFL